MDTAAAELATGIKPATMRKWLQRGKLTRHGHDFNGRAIVDLDELLALQPPRVACGSPTPVSH